MQTAGKVSDVHEVIMDASLLDERTLSIGDKVIHEGGESTGKNIGNDFCNGV